MGIDNTIYGLSNVNAILGSTLNYIDNCQNGMPQGAAISNLGYNIAYGGLRNMAARDIFQNSGSYLGYMVNSNAGYGTPMANYQGTLGTMGAMMFTTPWNNFGCYTPWMAPIYSCSPCCGGYFNPVFYGGTYYIPGVFNTFGYY